MAVAMPAACMSRFVLSSRSISIYMLFVRAPASRPAFGILRRRPPGVLDVSHNDAADDEGACVGVLTDALSTASPMAISSSLTVKPFRRWTSSRANVRNGSRTKCPNATLTIASGDFSVFPLVTVVLKPTMNNGNRASPTRQTVWTAKEIFRLSRLRTAWSPRKSSVYV